MSHIRDLIAAGRTLSFEFFPPKTEEGLRALEKTLHELEPLHPSFVSMTYGAGGSTRDATRDLVVEINRSRSYPAMAHLTCMGQRREQLAELLLDYADNDVHNILALAGDPPQDGSPETGDLRYALELVDLVRSLGDFTVGVAAFPELHPRSEASRQDRQHLVAKLAAADFGISQFFFDPVPYFRMIEDINRVGCVTPVLPGIMPVLNPATVLRFAQMNGARVPPGLWGRLESATPDDRFEIAVEQATMLCEELLDAGAPGIHLYSLNRSDAAVRIATNLGLVDQISVE